MRIYAGPIIKTILPMPERFISEPIEPAPGTANVTALTRGEPGLMGAFVWRGDEYRVEAVLEQWKQADARDGCEKDIRKHWYRVRTAGGDVMTSTSCGKQRRQNAAKHAGFCIRSEAMALHRNLCKAAS